VNACGVAAGVKPGASLGERSVSEHGKRPVAFPGGGQPVMRPGWVHRQPRAPCGAEPS
jgi:hypothetical protein